MCCQVEQRSDLRLDVTSSAVVGSSATSSRGSQTSDIAIMMRWHRPPPANIGYIFATARAGNADRRDRPDRSVLCLRLIPKMVRTVSVICAPTVKNRIECAHRLRRSSLIRGRAASVAGRVSRRPMIDPRCRCLRRQQLGSEARSTICAPLSPTIQPSRRMHRERHSEHLQPANRRARQNRFLIGRLDPTSARARGASTPAMEETAHYSGRSRTALFLFLGLAK